MVSIDANVVSLWIAPVRMVPVQMDTREHASHRGACGCS
jgi:hypothetical protein